MLSVNDLALRAPRPLADGEILDLGGKRVRYLATPHVPHCWDAGLLFEETTKTLFSGDLFTQIGKSPALSDEDLIGPALAAEDTFGATALTPNTAPTIRRLATLQPVMIALMHGPAFHGNCERALLDLADGYAKRLQTIPAKN
jgi:flavorubredoxin